MARASRYHERLVRNPFLLEGTGIMPQARGGVTGQDGYGFAARTSDAEVGVFTDIRARCATVHLHRA
jgi:hypothetical protein